MSDNKPENSRKKKEEFFTRYGRTECTMGILFIVIGAAVIRYLPVGSLILFIVGAIDMYAACKDHADLTARREKKKKG